MIDHLYPSRSAGAVDRCCRTLATTVGWHAL